MRLHPRIVGTVSIAALTLGLGLVTASPASAAGSSEKSSQGVKAKLVVKDVKNKTGKVSVGKWITLKVTTPPAVEETYGPKPVTWRANVKVTGSPSCAGSTYVPSVDGSNTWMLPFEATTKKGTKYERGIYIASGACKVTAEVTAYRYTSVEGAAIDTTFKVKANGAIQNKTKSTIKASSSKVKKNSKVKLSGKVQFQKASPKVYYKFSSAKKGTKLVLEFKSSKAKKWSKVKNIKVGKSGKWSTSTKVKKAGSYRVVVQATNHYQKSSSKAVKVSVR